MSSKRPMFVPVEFDLLDTGAASVAGHMAVLVLVVLHRNVRRTPMTFGEYPTDRWMIAAGRHVTQEAIAKLLGIAESKVFKYLARLKQLRWIKQLSVAGTNEPTYVIGRRTRTPNGRCCVARPQDRLVAPRLARRVWAEPFRRPVPGASPYAGTAERRNSLARFGGFSPALWR